MKITNVVELKINMDILKRVPNSYQKVEELYKGISAPAVVFEEADDIVAVAYTIEQYENIIAPFSIENSRKTLEEGLETLSIFVASKLSKKYSLTSSYTKELDSLVADVEKYLVDSTVSTPTLDLYSDMNSRSRAEEVEAVVRMQKFLQKSGNCQMVSQKAIDRTTTKEQFSVVAKSLSRFKNISTKQEFLDIVDTEIEAMKNV